jgi:hypothetical protein
VREEWARLVEVELKEFEGKCWGMPSLRRSKEAIAGSISFIGSSRASKRVGLLFEDVIIIESLL